MHPSEAIRGTAGEELLGKTVVLAVSGSIAAVEAVKLARELVRHGADVYGVMSEAALGIIHPNALWFASGRPPVVELDGSVAYLDLCGRQGKADLFLVAPATANTISKMATGVDDTTVTTFATTALGAGLPILVAPAMDAVMFDQPLLQENIRKLEDLGVEFVEPLRAEEKAKMAEVESVVARTMRRLGPRDMVGQRVLVIAGSTAEPLDDIRVLTNRSTGEMGIELARSAFLRGADVELWLGQASSAVPSYLSAWGFETTEELLGRVSEIDHDLCAVPAAIGDYVPEPVEGKVPSGSPSWTVELRPNDRVLERIRDAFSGTLIGFKLESGVGRKELVSRAKGRLEELKLDYMVANEWQDVKPGYTEAVLLNGSGDRQELRGSKREVAASLWGAVLGGLAG
ncbi:MAG: bifunctional phosphopantothenoylcysteine decarboxylase/phosphopantothenate--cysteine ligase CoaBC [Thermoplasmata archaeon]